MSDEYSGPLLIAHCSSLIAALICRPRGLKGVAQGGSGIAPVMSNSEWTTRVMQEIDILWLTAGLGCDGDTVAITGATQPSLEDLVLGVIPHVPKINLYNAVLAYETGLVRPHG